MKKKIILIIIIVFIVFLVGLYFLIFKNTDKIVLNKDEFVFELGEDISADVSYYLKDADSTKNIKSYKLSSETLKIEGNKFILENTNYIELGEYKINITYKKINKEFIIKVIDTTSPEFEDFKEVIELEETTENVDLKNYFKVKDLTETKIQIEGEYDLTTSGEYKINVIAVDSSNNEITKESIIKVKEKPEETPKVNNTTINKTEPQKEESKSSNSTPSSNNTTTNKTETPVVASPRYRKDISDVYVSQVNAYRKANGLSELPVTAEAQNEADRRAKEISTYYSHDGAGYGFGENIGEGSVGVDFFTAWKNSPSHNAAMLREQNTAIAASVYEVDNHWYAVISFRMNY